MKKKLFRERQTQEEKTVEERFDEMFNEPEEVKETKPRRRGRRSVKEYITSCMFRHTAFLLVIG